MNKIIGKVKKFLGIPALENVTLPVVAHKAIITGDVPFAIIKGKVVQITGVHFRTKPLGIELRFQVSVDKRTKFTEGTVFILGQEASLDFSDDPVIASEGHSFELVYDVDFDEWVMQ